MSECLDWEEAGDAPTRKRWIECFGPIPDGKWVLHTCDNRRCWNLLHLYLGTPSRPDDEDDGNYDGLVEYGR